MHGTKWTSPNFSEKTARILHSLCSIANGCIEEWRSQSHIPAYPFCLVDFTDIRLHAYPRAQKEHKLTFDSQDASVVSFEKHKNLVFEESKCFRKSTQSILNVFWDFHACVNHDVTPDKSSTHLDNTVFNTSRSFKEKRVEHYILLISFGGKNNKDYPQIIESNA